MAQQGGTAITCDWSHPLLNRQLSAPDSRRVQAHNFPQSTNLKPHLDQHLTSPHHYDFPAHPTARLSVAKAHCHAKMCGNPVAGKLNVLASTLFSYVYAPVGETDIALKAHELWCDGKQIEVCPYSDNAAIEKEAAVYEKLEAHREKYQESIGKNTRTIGRTVVVARMTARTLSVYSTSRPSIPPY